MNQTKNFNNKDCVYTRMRQLLTASRLSFRAAQRREIPAERICRSIYIGILRPLAGSQNDISWGKPELVAPSWFG